MWARKARTELSPLVRLGFFPVSHLDDGSSAWKLKKLSHIPAGDDRLYASRPPRPGHRQHLLVEFEPVGARLVVARIPAIRFLQPGIERRELHFENPGHLPDVL